VHVVITSAKLVDETVIRQTFVDQTEAGYPIHLTSVVSGVGLPELRQQVEGKISALAGPSGVGKSSLMNKLFPGLNLRIAEISEQRQQGPSNDGGCSAASVAGRCFVADTPGLARSGTLEHPSRRLAALLPGIPSVAQRVPLRGLSAHGGTWVRNSRSGEDWHGSRGRYESYIKLRENWLEGAGLW
jgi:ribosome biogenesis GTPase